jgi:quercetin dioxygenase-like cupin family protein
VVEDNDQVRILKSVMKPGDKTAMHGHPALVACAINDGSYRFTTPDGQTMEVSW